MKKSEAVQIIKDTIDGYGCRSSHELAQEVLRVSLEVIKMHKPLNVVPDGQSGTFWDNEWESEDETK